MGRTTARGSGNATGRGIREERPALLGLPRRRSGARFPRRGAGDRASGEELRRLGPGTVQLSSTAGTVNGSSSASSADSDAIFAETVRTTAVHVVLAVLTTTGDRSSARPAATAAEAVSARAGTSADADVAKASSSEAIRTPSSAAARAAY